MTAYKPGLAEPSWRTALSETPSHVCCMLNS